MRSSSDVEKAFMALSDAVVAVDPNLSIPYLSTDKLGDGLFQITLILVDQPDFKGDLSYVEET